MRGVALCNCCYKAILSGTSLHMLIKTVILLATNITRNYAIKRSCYDIYSSYVITDTQGLWKKLCSIKIKELFMDDSLIKVEQLIKISILLVMGNTRNFDTIPSSLGLSINSIVYWNEYQKAAHGQ